MSNQYLIMNGNSFLSSSAGQIKLFREEVVQSLLIDDVEKHHFFSDSHSHYFVLNLKERNSHESQLQLGDEWLNLRSQLGRITDSEFQFLGRAQQIVRWYKEHQYCGACGNKTVRQASEFAMSCSNCELLFYPKISPCIIVLVTRGQECLLAHHAKSSSPRYSCLAGFIETGETPEQTLVREVMEEVGIKVHNLRYKLSQAWPFPGQLMLGYFADYLEGDLHLDNNEIVSARWFSKDDLPEIPPVGTIARQLIDQFVNE